MNQSRFAFMQKPKQSTKQSTKQKNIKPNEQPTNSRFKSEDFFTVSNTFNSKTDINKDNDLNRGIVKEPKLEDNRGSRRYDREKIQLNISKSKSKSKLDINITNFPDLLQGQTQKLAININDAINYTAIVKKTEPKKGEKIDPGVLNINDKEVVNQWVRKYKNDSRYSEYLEEEKICDFYWSKWHIKYEIDKKQREIDGEKFYEVVAEEEYDYDSDASSDNELYEKDIYDN